MPLSHGFWVIALSILTVLSIATAVPAAQDAPAGVRDWEASWNTVLQRNVDDAGRIDFASLARDRAELDRVVAFIASNSPDSQPGMFPGRSEKLAYYINAYNALAMYGVVDAGIPDNLGGLRKFTFFYLRKFNIGGKRISLYDFENDVIRPIGEERIHFALNCMVVGCPRLPRVAFTAEQLDRQLDSAARTFVGEIRNVRLDPGDRKLWLSAIFKFYTDDFLAHAPSLAAYINRLRTDKIPHDFDVRFLDYDWTVNARTRSLSR